MDCKVTVNLNPVLLEFEAGSPEEALAGLIANRETFSRIYAEFTNKPFAPGTGGGETVTLSTQAQNIGDTAGDTDAAAPEMAGNSQSPAPEMTSPASTTSTADGPKKRGRRTNAEIAAAKAAEEAAKAATAPAPIPVGAAPVAPGPVLGTVPGTVDHTPTPNGIPQFLNRAAAAGINPPAFVAPTAPAPAVAPPPAPVAPAAAPPPPPAPMAPPAAPGVNAELNRKIIEVLKANAPDSAPDTQTQYVAWLVTSGVCHKGATFNEAMATLQFEAEPKMKALAVAMNMPAA